MDVWKAMKMCQLYINWWLRWWIWSAFAHRWWKCRWSWKIRCSMGAQRYPVSCSLCWCRVRSRLLKPSLHASSPFLPDSSKVLGGLPKDCKFVLGILPNDWKFVLGILPNDLGESPRSSRSGSGPPTLSTIFQYQTCLSITTEGVH